MIQYFRGDGNHPIGAMVAIYDEIANTVRIGWSKCNKKDTFVRDRALTVARKRTEAGSILNIPSSRQFIKHETRLIEDAENIGFFFDLPMEVVIPSLPEQYEIFVKRVVTYFKSVPVENFYVCGPEDDMTAIVIKDAREADIERQSIKAGK